ncbi:hypothetical protein I79_014110 [Cricetulus griseus]|uniref:Uncharacterized protein n=1 Tax=Cricetulus griseus TaxID=10029 RepID=G3HT88_CRIGR|nr:hypothetical protein I79_014110 [Cricetulus griseus]
MQITLRKERKKTINKGRDGKKKGRRQRQASSYCPHKPVQKILFFLRRGVEDELVSLKGV